MEIKKWNKFRLVFGPIVLLTAVTLLVFWKDTDNRITGLILTLLLTLGITTTINGFLWPKERFFKFPWIYSDTPEEDERTRKIGAFATAYAWFITLMLITILMFLDLLNLLKMKGIEVLILIFLVMIGATVGLYAYFRRKGDVG